MNLHPPRFVLHLVRRVWLLPVLIVHLSAWAQGTAFTYQGRLDDSGQPANGSYNLTFSLFTTGTGGTAVAGPVTTNGVVVSNGLFTVTIDFGARVWNGYIYWLQIGAETNGAGSFTTLTPRQELTPAPYAVFATTSSNVLGVLSSSSLAGTYSSPVTLNNPADSFMGSFSGNGANLANVNAATLGGLGSAGFWQLSGNNVLGGQFLGSTNNQAVELWANRARALRLEPTGVGVANLIGGSPFNYASAGVVGATVAGGGATNTSSANAVTAGYGSILGGYQNTAGGVLATVGGGIGNSAGSVAAVIGGGQFNRISLNSDQATISGGTNNVIRVSAAFATIGGGYQNSAGTTGSTVGGGGNNNASGAYAVVSGGYDNIASNFYAFVGGGSDNSAGGNTSAIGGGANNITSAAYATVGGGVANTAGGFEATVGGGYLNAANGQESTVGGGHENTASGQWATVSGGNGNLAGANYAAVGGGLTNLVNSVYATVGGGAHNAVQASADYSFIGGGFDNVIASAGLNSVIAGGFQNTIRTACEDGAVGGGAVNVISNGVAYATIPGGYENVAAGSYSFAAGQQAQALHQGTFVWADSQNASFASTGGNQFLIRAQNGVGINTPNPTDAALSIAGRVRMNDNNIYFRTGTDPNHGLGFFGSGSLNGSFAGTNVNGPVLWGNGGGALGTFNGSQAISLLWTTTSVSVYGTFNNNSDRNAKRDFTSIAPAQILELVAHLPLSEWSYKSDAATRHIGPMAQDFYSTFNLGTDDKHIAPMDEGGVALAAIQGLNHKVESENAALRAESAELKARLQKLEQLISPKTGGSR